MKILIGTPAYDQQLTTPYVTSVVQLIQDNARRQTGIEFELEIRTSPDIAQLRNYFASRMLSDESYSHLLFIDADMGFPPQLIDKLLNRNKPVVAAFSPHKSLDVPRLHRFARRYDNADEAMAAATTWVCEADVIAGKRGTPEFDADGFTRVRLIGTGIMLLERSVLHRMREAYPDLWLKSVPPGYFGSYSGGALLCFAPLRDQTTGLFVTEDVAFCRRWTDRCGGEIWACASESITHLGRFPYKGRLMDKFELDQRQRARLEEAVVANRAALEERTRARVPLEWAATQENLGLALTKLGASESGTARLEEAVAAYRAALEEWTRERLPLEWARAQVNLGNALWALGARESGTARLEEAVAAYRAALEELTREQVPYYEMTQRNLAGALAELERRKQ